MLKRDKYDAMVDLADTIDAARRKAVDANAKDIASQLDRLWSDVQAWIEKREAWAEAHHLED